MEQCPSHGSLRHGIEESHELDFYHLYKLLLALRLELTVSWEPRSSTNIHFRLRWYLLFADIILEYKDEIKLTIFIQ
ncbi:hypothetical protein DSO57_1028806 [Entomophthora muscae]|uniref:Uncharacterized protein n=1 Tax=Entomophthora muscae TaxID=34485 RepID=A0ACC2RGG6_9FUNG|nr:hypothetical protein DSO57_1028806 [Entomophthora muscae]